MKRLLSILVNAIKGGAIGLGVALVGIGVGYIFISTEPILADFIHQATGLDPMLASIISVFLVGGVLVGAWSRAIGLMD